ncbi:MAG TPA: hypothetical protein VGX92_17415 [Pyrinomonadaceae bacterium]|jgi:hypothetical protein|nr:hypothetical protein [Pyrinomonadaceae bacterium]
MAKKTVRNSSNQPLYVNLPGGRSMKIPARSNVEVEETDLNSSELALQQSRGNIILVEAAAAAAEEKEGAADKAAPGERAAARDEKFETRTEAHPQPAGKAMDEEGGKD